MTMNLMRKISTAMRSSARESAEQLIDANQLRIFEQEIVDLESSLGIARRQLTAVIAERLQLERARSSQDARIAQREAQAVKALTTEHGTLVRELARDVVEQQRQRAQLDQAIERLVVREEALLKRVRAAAAQAADYRRELSVARAVDGSQRAAILVGSHVQSMDGGLDELRGSLARIRGNQQQIDDRLAASQMLERKLDDRLDSRLAAAGIDVSEDAVDAVVERLREASIE